MLSTSRNKKSNKIVIRFRKRGYYKNPFYDIVVTLQGKPSGAFIEKIGHFHPSSRDRVLAIDSFRLGMWVSRGAVVNSSVKKYLAKFVGVYAIKST